MTSIFSAARNFKQQQNTLNQAKPQKSVRFFNATPNSKKNNDNHENEEMEVEEPEETTVNVNIGGFAFNECGMIKNPIVHTPVPKGFKSKNHDFANDEDDEETFIAKFKKTPTLPTPMAMRDVSKRAQIALARLYISNDDTETDDTSNNFDDSTTELKPKALFQSNSDDYDI